MNILFTHPLKSQAACVSNLDTLMTTRGTRCALLIQSEAQCNAETLQSGLKSAPIKTRESQRGGLEIKESTKWFNFNQQRNQTWDFWPQWNIFPQLCIISNLSPTTTNSSYNENLHSDNRAKGDDLLTHSTNFQMRQIREDVEKDFVGKFLNGLESKKSQTMKYLKHSWMINHKRLSMYVSLFKNLQCSQKAIFPTQSRTFAMPRWQLALRTDPWFN